MKFDFSSYWYRDSKHPITIFLLPFSWLFQFITYVRYQLYRLGIFKIERVSKPVIVVGNITVGGTGKTPLVIWLAHYLQSLGYRPGIVSRGVGGKKMRQPILINANSDVKEVGDEALLLSRKTSHPVVISIDRPRAAKKIIADCHCDIVISDDGLQHYRLGRDIEIALVDSERLFGNQQLLPAGPLREKMSRLDRVDFTIINGVKETALNMTYAPLEFVSVKDANIKKPLDAFAGQTVHAFAAIGHPQKFFSTLQNLRINILTHVFPDHYLYAQDDFKFNDTFPIIMTEKDAVKCAAFADERYWYLKIDVEVSEEFKALFLQRIKLVCSLSR